MSTRRFLRLTSKNGDFYVAANRIVAMLGKVDKRHEPEHKSVVVLDTGDTYSACETTEQIVTAIRTMEVTQ